jgi:hypothetical protein
MQNSIAPLTAALRDNLMSNLSFPCFDVGILPQHELNIQSPAHESSECVTAPSRQVGLFFVSPALQQNLG